MLVNEKKNTQLHEDLMSKEFPSIWCEEVRENDKNLRICGFYREWSTNGIRSVETQLKSIRTFVNQLEKTTNDKKSVLVMGDANLCSLKWNDPDYNLFI